MGTIFFASEAKTDTAQKQLDEILTEDDEEEETQEQLEAKLEKMKAAKKAKVKKTLPLN